MNVINEENNSIISLNNKNELVVHAKDSIMTSSTVAIESIEIRAVRSDTCYICLENITTMCKQFGLQNNCDHYFCFDCLSTWRRTGSMIDKDTGGRCPLCRVRSTFIAPSWRCFNDTDDKQSLIDEHKLHLKTIPCRTLLQYGYCRFGHRCYYNHNIQLLLSTVHRTVSSNIFQWNTRRSIYENNDNDQQEPPRRMTYNSHRYRPY